MEAKPKKAAKKKPPALPKDWEALKAFLPGLPGAERRALEGLAQGKTLSEEEANLAKKALFKLRMRKGRARKEVAPA
jgi:DNA topoisomerase-1